MISCPSCGAGLRFDIAEQKMVCDHCQNRFDAQALSDDSARDDAKASCFDSYVYTCPSCGAEIITTDKNDAVGFCQYCGGASLIFDKIRQEWKPEHIIPFQITKEQCKEAYRKAAAHNPFVSKKYRDPQLIEGFRGVYMPYWSYRASVSGNFVIKATAPREHESGNTYIIRHYNLYGSSDGTLDGFSHDASLNFDDDLSETLAPFDSTGQQPFAPGYLSGFYAETGNVNPHEYDEAIADEIRENAVGMLERNAAVSDYINKYKLSLDSGASSVPSQIQSVSRTLNPVWFMSRRDGGDITYAAVNGQTGKVSADFPLSPLRILVAALGISAAVYALLLLLMGVMPSIKANSTLGFCLILMNAGMYYLQNSFNRTVAPNPAKKSKFFGSGGFTVFVIICLLTFIFIVTDGSYGRKRALIVVLPFFASCFFMLFCHGNQISDTWSVRKLRLANISPLRQRVAEEGKRFVGRVVWLKIVMYVTLAIGVLIAFADLPARWITYGMCILAATELFGLAIFHIHFQTQVAKRPLPQFNKKGAQYDEN